MNQTVGKTYMACGGLNLTESDSKNTYLNSPTYRTVQMAMAMVKFIEGYTYKAGKRLHIKIGVHYGSCIYGVLGYHKPQFSLIGDTVNTTSRHCTTGSNDSIVLSESCWNQIKLEGLVKTTSTRVAMKGKGEDITVYIVLRKSKVLASKKSKKARNSNISEASRRISFNPSIQSSSANYVSRNSISPMKISVKPSMDQQSPGVKDNLNSSQLDRSAQDDDNMDRSMVSNYQHSYSMLDDLKMMDAEPQSLPAIEENNGLDGDNTSKLYNSATLGDKEDIVLDEHDDKLGQTESFLNDENKRAYFESKMMVEYGGKITLALSLILLDISISECIIWADNNITDKFKYFRFINVVIALIVLTLIVLKQVRDSVRTFKMMVFFIVICRTFNQVIEYFLTYYTDNLDFSTRKYRYDMVNL